jgi:hypothetical protein
MCKLTATLQCKLTVVWMCRPAATLMCRLVTLAMVSLENMEGKHRFCGGGGSACAE